MVGPKILESLTPPWLNFHIVKKSTKDIQQGSLIDYKLKIHGVPVRWQTLISQWQPQAQFIDEQIRGPYKRWHHVHKFESVPGGTLISDEVTFRIPAGPFGKALVPFIAKDVRAIFRFRQKTIEGLEWASN